MKVDPQCESRVSSYRFELANEMYMIVEHTLFYTGDRTSRVRLYLCEQQVGQTKDVLESSLTRRKATEYVKAYLAERIETLNQE